MLLRSPSADHGDGSVTNALGNDDFVQSANDYPEGSVGSAICHLLHACFPYESIAGLAQRFQNSPSRLECELQVRLGLCQEE
jgi:hypothetical protein